MSGRPIEFETSPKQYGFKSKTLKLYRMDDKYFLKIGGLEHGINGGSFNQLLEGIGGMTPEGSEEYIRDEFSGGRVKKI